MIHALKRAAKGAAVSVELAVRVARQRIEQAAHDVGAGAIASLATEASRVRATMEAEARGELNERRKVVAFIEREIAVHEATDGAVHGLRAVAAAICREDHWKRCSTCGACLDEHTHLAHCGDGPEVPCSRLACP